MSFISRSNSVSSSTTFDYSAISSANNEKTQIDRYLENLSDIQEDKEKVFGTVEQVFESRRNNLTDSKRSKYSNIISNESGNAGVHMRNYRLVSPKLGLSRHNSVLSQISVPMSDTSPALPVNHDLTQNYLASKINLLDTMVSSKFKGYHHATWYCSNAKQTASYFVHCFGFKWIAYKGLETGSRLVASHVVQNGDVIFEFTSPIVSAHREQLNWNDSAYISNIHAFIERHGDGVKDLSFEVDDVDFVFQHAIDAGAKSIVNPTVMKDEFGEIKIATVEVFDDVNHTLIENKHYYGFFIPGYAKVEGNDLYELTEAHSVNNLPLVRLSKIDHCVQNEDWDKLKEACDVYTRIFGFHKFWSVDEKDVSTEYSALRSIVMSSSNELIKMPLNEPAKGKCKSQIEEFLTFYNGSGVQHIAVLTDNIIETVGNMKKRGAAFIKVPPLYYTKLLPRLLECGVEIEEDLKVLEKHDILIDFDANGYLLQIFTKPLTDRPTFFLEVIQRHNHNGFGKGNFKTLFETIEAEQKLRGTL